MSKQIAYKVKTGKNQYEVFYFSQQKNAFVSVGSFGYSLAVAKVARLKAE